MLRLRLPGFLGPASQMRGCKRVPYRRLNYPPARIDQNEAWCQVPLAPAQQHIVHMAKTSHVNYSALPLYDRAPLLTYFTLQYRFPPYLSHISIVSSDLKLQACTVCVYLLAESRLLTALSCRLFHICAICRCPFRPKRGKVEVPLACDGGPVACRVLVIAFGGFIGRALRHKGPS